MVYLSYLGLASYYYSGGPVAAVKFFEWCLGANYFLQLRKLSIESPLLLR